MSKICAKGIDVSQFQGNIDWKRVKNSGIDFVIPRTGFGFSAEDKIFKVTVGNAIRNGVDIPAVYHFSYACSINDAVIEAEFAVSLCKKYGLDSNTIIFYDFEYESANYYEEQRTKRKRQISEKLTPKLVQDFTEAFCERVKKLGYKTGVYYNQDYFVNWYEYGKSFKPDYFGWLADLEGEPNYKCDFHQYSHTGRVAGVTTAVDMDYAFIDYKSLSSGDSNDKEVKIELKPNSVIANEVIQGLWGNGEERKKRLTDAGYNYSDVQALVNAALPVAKPKNHVTEEIVNDVIAGKYGNGDERRNKLESEGYVYKEVQDAVNRKLSGQQTQSTITSKVSPAQSHDKTLTGTYMVTALSLNLRYIPGLLTSSNVVKVLNQNETVQCWGYYTQKGNSKWLLIQQGSITGFVDVAYLKKI